MLTQAKKCFNEALHKTDNDEPWLQHYMLGKIAEKMCKPPEEYLESYLKVGFESLNSYFESWNSYFQSLNLYI